MSHLVQHSHFTQLGDRFKITVYAQTSPCVIAVSGRLQGDNGHRANFQHLITVSATGLQTVYRPASGEYWIMSCVVSVVSGTVNPGDVLVKVELVQGDPTNTVPHDTLIVGSPDSFVPVTMGSPGDWSVDGRRGRVGYTSVPGTATNTEVTITVPNGVMWNPIGLQYFISTVAVTGQASGYVIFNQTASDKTYEWDGAQLAGPGATLYIFGGKGVTHTQTSSPPVENFALPDMWLLPGGFVTVSYQNDTGTITIGSYFLSYQEYILGY